MACLSCIGWPVRLPAILAGMPQSSDSTVYYIDLYSNCKAQRLCKKLNVDGDLSVKFQLFKENTMFKSQLIQ